MTRQGALLLTLTALSLLALSPLWAPGYFYGAHDGRHSVFYLVQFDASFRDGALWPRWAMHHTQGYGYPTFIIQAPLGFYLAEIFILLGAGYTLAAKLSWITGNIVGAWGMFVLVRYWLLRSTEGAGDQGFVNDGAAHQEGLPINVAALAAGLLYTFAPYHLLGIYVRAALNDTLLLAWFPWVFLLFDRLLDRGLRQGWPQRLALAALCLGGILLTHAFALISFTPLLISFILFRLGLSFWQSRQWRPTLHRALLAAGAGLLALLLYANFLIPLLLEGSPNLKEQVYVSSTYDFHRHFVYWGQFFSPFWGFGYSDDPAGANDGMGFQVGVLLLLLAIIALYQLRQRLDHPPTPTPLDVTQLGSGQDGPLQSSYLIAVVTYLIVASVGLLTLMTPLTKALWEAVELLAIIQFPWRLLSLAAFTLSALGGVTVWLLASGSLTNRITDYDSEATAGFVLVGLLAIFTVYPAIGAPLEPVEAWREDGRAIAFFERAHPDMMGYTNWVQTNFTESPMTANYQSDNYREDYSENGPWDRLRFVSGQGEVLSRYSRGSTFGGVVLAEVPSTVRILLYHFPGWQVTIDNEPVAYTISQPEGLIDVQVPAGEHQLEARMGTTRPRLIGTILSGGALLLILIMCTHPYVQLALGSK